MSTATTDQTSAATKTTRRRPRGATGRHEVIAAALDLVDREGLDALTVRRLAAELDMEPMSLYKRVANKDDLITGIAELIWNEVAASAPPTDDWAGWLHTLGTAVRDAVRQHPNALPLLVAGDVFPTPMLEVIATQLERATPGWPDRRDAASAICTVTAFALGCALAECSYCTPTTSTDPATAERQRLRRIARALPADAPDRLIDTALDVCGTDAGDMFTNGLDLIIKGSRQP
ncbi:MAG: TetR/AcrR family transcriptional regulator C-terminal domain-containing protein [Acidimicrobiales bacterium]